MRFFGYASERFADSSLRNAAFRMTGCLFVDEHEHAFSAKVNKGGTMKFRLVLVIALAVFLCPNLSLAAAAEQPKTGGTLTMGINKDLTMMNAMVRTQSTDRSIRDLMYDSLLGIDLKGNI